MQPLDNIPLDCIIRAHRRHNAIIRAATLLHANETPTPLFYPTSNIESDTEDSEKSQDIVVEVENDSNDSKLITQARSSKRTEKLFKEIGDELLTRANEMSNRYGSKCTMYKVGDKILKALVWLLAFAAAAMSINGIQSVSSQNVEETMIFVGGIIIFLVPIVNEIREQFNLGRRSKKFLKYHHQFQEQVTKIRTLLYTTNDPLEGLEKLSRIERELNETDQKAFDVIINIGKTEETRQPFNFLTEKTFGVDQ